MKRLAIAFAVVALPLVAWSRWSHAVTAAPVAIFWSETQPEMTMQTNEHVAGAMTFTDAKQDRHAFVLLQRGRSVAVFHDVEHVRFVKVGEPRAWALAEGRDVFIVFRTDDGETWQASRISKPAEQTRVVSWEVDGDTVSIHCSNERKLHVDDMEPWEPFVLSLPSALRPVEYAGDVVFRTRDGGRSWRLTR